MITIHRLGIPFKKPTSFWRDPVWGIWRRIHRISANWRRVAVDRNNVTSNLGGCCEHIPSQPTILFVVEMWTTACCWNNAWFFVFFWLLCYVNIEANKACFSQDSMFNTITMWDPKMKRSDQWPSTINQSTGHFECLPLFEFFNAFSIQYPHCCHTGHRSHHVGSINFSFVSTSPNFSLRSCG